MQWQKDIMIKVSAVCPIKHLGQNGIARLSTFKSTVYRHKLSRQTNILTDNTSVDTVLMLNEKC